MGFLAQRSKSRKQPEDKPRRWPNTCGPFRSTCGRSSARYAKPQKEIAFSVIYVRHSSAAYASTQSVTAVGGKASRGQQQLRKQRHQRWEHRRREGQAEQRPFPSRRRNANLCMSYNRAYIQTLGKKAPEKTTTAVAAAISKTCEEANHAGTTAAKTRTDHQAQSLKIWSGPSQQHRPAGKRSFAPTLVCTRHTRRNAKPHAAVHPMQVAPSSSQSSPSTLDGIRRNQGPDHTTRSTCTQIVMNTFQGKTRQAVPKHTLAQKLTQRAYRTKQPRNGNTLLRMDERSNLRTPTGSRKRCTMQSRMPFTQDTSWTTTEPPGACHNYTQQQHYTS